MAGVRNGGRGGGGTRDTEGGRGKEEHPRSLKKQADGTEGKFDSTFQAMHRRP